MAQFKNQNRKLKYAVICNGDRPPEWARPIIEDLISRPEIENEVVINVNESTDGRHARRLIVLREMATESLTPAELGRRIRELNLDFALNLSESRMPAEIVSCFQHGIWVYRFGDACSHRDIGRLEILRGETYQDVRLERRYGLGAVSAVLKSGALKLFSHSLPYHRRATIQQSAQWAGDAAVYLSKHKALPIESMRAESATLSIGFAHFTLVSIRVALKKLGYLYDKIRRQFVFQQWNIGVAPASLEDYAEAKNSMKLKWWRAPDSPTCLADPFPVLINNRLHVFAEKFSYVDQFGTIVSMSVDENGEPIDSVEAIQFPHHLSYPCLTQKGSDIFATFEALETKELTIYRCEKFPRKWVRHGVVASGSAFADPTLFEHEGRWWVFATTFDSISAGNTALNAWYCEDGLDGQWKPHELNPIKTDIRSARSGGSVFTSNGELFRPSQNCMERYGRSLNIMRINCLTPSKFDEVKVREISPDAHYPDATHHISGVGAWTIVDGRRDSFSLWIGWMKLRRLFRQSIIKQVYRSSSSGEFNWADVVVSPVVPHCLAAMPWP